MSGNDCTDFKTVLLLTIARAHALQFAQLAEKITQLESAEAQRSLQLQPLIQGQAAEHVKPTIVAHPVAATHGTCPTTLACKEDHAR